MFSWECTSVLKQQKRPLEVFRKKNILKNFAIFTRKHLCWSLSGVFGVNFIKKRLQQRYFPVNITNFENTYFKEHLGTTASSTAILKNTSEQLLAFALALLLN